MYVARTCALKSICLDEINMLMVVLSAVGNTKIKNYRYPRVGGDREWSIFGEAAFRYAMIFEAERVLTRGHRRCYLPVELAYLFKERVYLWNRY